MRVYTGFNNDTKQEFGFIGNLNDNLSNITEFHNSNVIKDDSGFTSISAIKAAAQNKKMTEICLKHQDTLNNHFNFLLSFFNVSKIDVSIAIHILSMGRNYTTKRVDRAIEMIEWNQNFGTGNWFSFSNRI